jgi:hypothetical protein
MKFVIHGAAEAARTEAAYEWMSVRYGQGCPRSDSASHRDRISQCRSGSVLRSTSRSSFRSIPDIKGFPTLLEPVRLFQHPYEALGLEGPARAGSFNYRGGLFSFNRISAALSQQTVFCGRILCSAASDARTRVARA